MEFLKPRREKEEDKEIISIHPKIIKKSRETTVC